MKLWQKDFDVDKKVETFTVGKDRELDLDLAPYDVLGSIAHATMLAKVGLLTEDEKDQLVAGLQQIYKEVEAGDFEIKDGIEDVHSQVEFLLTERLGTVGKKLHSGRSRNDQVLVDLKLYMRGEIEQLVDKVSTVFGLLNKLSEEHKELLMPGYTHMQVAMPSSFGLWFGAYAEALIDDLEVLKGAYKVVNKNPLGSAAGYGSSFPLDRQMTTDLLGFEVMNYNVVYAQMGRGKVEYIVSNALASIAATVNKLSMDTCLYMGQNFGFFSFPSELTTGSSIMPHKKNPDVLELTRAKCNQLLALPTQVSMLTSNLPVGYHRDFQQIKELLMPAFGMLNDCLDMVMLMFSNITINKDILDDEKYHYLFSVEVVNQLVLEGVPFREAYKQVGMDIEKGTFKPQKEVNHTHAGSIGNLCNEEIAAEMQKVVDGFEFKSLHEKLKALLA
ncbi:argininosuccinate lyase [Sediminitomix flava]|uniref:Argininosuccinate lyase n=1 Tax=Sediminitomix flava TaxID=379075 RepID=A0A315Z6J4_SEDFL|nr:argininosuccinate lyase [Sediminitomix flava]PWJ39332.1 argininosuccinate lyase [Sediminitomix flava]